MERRGVVAEAVVSPGGSVGPALARERERQFIEGLEEQLRDSRRLPSPDGGRGLKRGKIRSRVRSARDIARELARWGVRDADRIDGLPVGRSISVDGRRRGFLRRPRRLRIVARVLSPLRELAIQGNAHRPLDSEAVIRAVHDEIHDPSVHHVVVLCSTTGWTAESRSELPRGRHLSVVLVAPTRSADGRIVWTSTDSLPEELSSLRGLFDPEPSDDKHARIRRAIEARPELQIPGGHVSLDTLSHDLEESKPAIDAVVTELCRGRAGYQRLKVRGTELLKRKRFEEALR